MGVVGSIASPLALPIRPIDDLLRAFSLDGNGISNEGFLF